ncbi:hypothetical protein WG907_09415 [Sphingobium sp. AN558]|uniref:hypothetical protein n=1 Tax=Sphingobium sp. AN558 TaxID=3133442 RepID=UPI0030BACA05
MYKSWQPKVAKKDQWLVRKATVLDSQKVPPVPDSATAISMRNAAKAAATLVIRARSTRAYGALQFTPFRRASLHSHELANALKSMLGWGLNR